MNVCKFEGCTNESRALDLCQAHRFQQRQGKELSPLRARKSKYVGCKQDDCEGVHYSKGYCRKHHGQLERGTLGLEPRITPPCSIDGCEIKNFTHGMCKKHYANWYYYERLANPRPVNTAHHNYKGDDAGIAAIHFRIRNTRGAARTYFCIDCDEQAKDWSLKHDAKGKQVFDKPGNRDDGAFYSLDVMDYEPRCQDCHAAYDAKHGNKRTYTYRRGDAA